MAQEQRSALEEQISTVASGSLTTAMDKQQEIAQGKGRRRQCEYTGYDASFDGIAVPSKVTR